MVSQTEHLDVPPWLADHFIGGHPALDFVNTQSHRLDASMSVDRFNQLDKIVTWLLYQQLLTQPQAQSLVKQAAQHKSELRIVKSLKKLRTQAGNIFDAMANDLTAPAPALSKVLSIAGKENIEIKSINHDGYQASAFSIKEISSMSVPALIALLIVDAVFRLPSERIRSCPACGWVFYDHSKGGRRKWCDMKACGNREKVARHYYSHRNS